MEKLERMESNSKLAQVVEIQTATIKKGRSQLNRKYMTVAGEKWKKCTKEMSFETMKNY